MTCRICGGEVDDPFWDDLCPECEHDIEHDPFVDCGICGMCAAEVEQMDEDDYQALAAAREAWGS